MPAKVTRVGLGKIAKSAGSHAASQIAALVQGFVGSSRQAFAARRAR